MTATTNARSVPNYRAGQWSIDPRQSSIEFTIRLLGGKTRGRFTNFDATIHTADDLLASSVSTTIDLASIDTGNKKRDAHLRSARYLNVEEQPEATYRSTRVGISEGGFRIEGDLTLFGITHRVPLVVADYTFTAAHSSEQRATFRAIARIDRRDFGFKIPKDGGGWVVSNKVQVILHVTANPAA